ncbi:hypothetical protein N7467_002632 [Penicillium canescens]|nr:hypothetical protein N7467_002632 [Penicillium canescens]
MNVLSKKLQSGARVSAFVALTARDTPVTEERPNRGIIYSYDVGLSELCYLILQSALGLSANGELFSVNFFRIFLDEAHVIKNRRSNSIQTAVSCECQRARTGSDGSDEHLMPASLIEIRTTSNCSRDMQHNPPEHLHQRGSEESEGPLSREDA